MTTAEIKKMSISERIRTMEAIWDSLLYEDIYIPSPEWHKNTLAERKNKIDDGLARWLPIREVKERHE